MTKQKYWVAGNTHVDLAWKKDRFEMAEIFDMFIVRLLDILEHHPTFTYVIEQAALYRDLAQRRPDLIKRLAQFVQEGRVEMVGGMAASLETNIPNGESYVRNQLLGIKWVEDHFGVSTQIGWLIDTFGINSQVPQILNQFGIRRLMANRFGGNRLHDVFRSRGLDGSEILVAGRDTYAPYIKPGHVFFRYIANWTHLDSLFHDASKASGDGPYLVMAYTENENLPSLRPLHWIDQGNNNAEQQDWAFSTLTPFFDALEETRRDWPVVHGDLNPEFTGTFSLRTPIRLRNRQVENKLLEAEKWATLYNVQGWKQVVHDAWWEMAFIQFHDVLTGSHPTHVYQSVLESLDAVEANANALLKSTFAVEEAATTSSDVRAMTLVNGLPWDRQDIASIPLPGGTTVGKITDGEEEVPFEIHGDSLKVRVDIPALGTKSLVLESGPVAAQPQFVEVDSCVIENEYLLLECDSQHMITRLVWKATNHTIIDKTGDLLVLQQDKGNFQIEEPVGAEIPAIAGTFQVLTCPSSALGRRVLLKGAFPSLSWCPEPTPLTWEAEFALAPGKPSLDLSLRLYWTGEESRVRLKLATTLDSSTGIYEIPFGVESRQPYRECGTTRGEWPVHRFVALEDQVHGLGLANTGVAGVEVSGGSIRTTLFRAPKNEYAGMVPDDSSSQHGQHEYTFRVIPYKGTWKTSELVRIAQELNNPVLSFHTNTSGRKESSLMSLGPTGMVLSTVKSPEDGSDELVIRLYETFGEAGVARLFVNRAQNAWLSNLKEDRLDAVGCENGVIQVPMNPFEIKTIRVARR